jgi:hypothetical protein
MSSENGKTVFEEAAAERQLEELRRGIEEWRRRRRSANDAFDAFLKRFDESPATAAVAAPEVSPPAHAAEVPCYEEPRPRYEEPQRSHAEPREPRNDQPLRNDEPLDEGLLAFAPAPSTAAPVTQPPPPAPLSSLADFAEERAAPSSPELRSIPAALAPARRSPARRIAPIVVVAAAGILLATLLWRGRSQEEAAPPTVAVVPSAAEAPAPPPPAAATAGIEAPPTAEVSTIRRVWLRVSVDGARVVEREVAENTTIPLRATSQIVIRAGDAGAVRVSVGGKDQGALGAAGQPATRTFAVK